MATILLFKGGQNEDPKIFLREFKRAFLFGTIGAPTQNHWVRLFLKLLERKTLMWFEGLPVEQKGTWKVLFEAFVWEFGQQENFDSFTLEMMQLR